MTDLFTTTGRRMTRNLQHALDNLTGADRRRAIHALAQSSTGVLGPLHEALAMELRLCDLRDEDTLRRLADDHDDTDNRPWPKAPTDGTTWWPEGGDVA